VEDELKALLDSVSLIPVLPDGVPDVIPCVTFHFFSENGALFGAGKATEETASCQIDIWYSEKSAEIKSTISSIKNLIKNKRTYSYPVKGYIYEAGSRIHHTYFTFEIINESEV
jgi:hypothetical protein